MKHVSPILLLLVAASCSPTQVSEEGGGLEFESLTSEHQAERGQKTIMASFRFTNRSADPIQIVKIDTSCGCLRAEADKSSYAPGDSGTIEAEFEFAGKTGEVENWMSVQTDSPDVPEKRLTVKVDIPLLIEIEPKMASWVLGGAASPQKVIVRVLQEEPIHVTEVSSSRGAVSATLHTIEKGRHYEIELKPQSTDDFLLGMVSIQTDCEIPEQQRQLAFYQIDSLENIKAEEEAESE